MDKITRQHKEVHYLDLIHPILCQMTPQERIYVARHILSLVGFGDPDLYLATIRELNADCQLVCAVLDISFSDVTGQIN